MSNQRRIPIKNIYFLLCYALEIIEERDFRLSDPEDCDSQQELLARLIEKEVERQLKQGLYCTYQNRYEDLPTVRGRIVMSSTIQNLCSCTHKIGCNFDELSINNIYNKIVKTTMYLLLNSDTVKKETKAALRKLMPRFSNVSLGNPKQIPWNALRFDQSNRRYRVLLKLCKLVIKGLLIDDKKDGERLSHQLSEGVMHKVYEKFILNYYKYHYPELLPTVSQVRWDLTDNTWSGYLPTMQTDAVLTGVSKLIIDAKYYKKACQYNFGTPKFYSNNMYQIYTYVKNESGSSDRDVAGMLLYARTQDEPKLQEAFCLGGNWFYVRTLDLDLSPADIRSQLDDIAKLASTSQCNVA